jgi:hypothetical protein
LVDLERGPTPVLIHSQTEIETVLRQLVDRG